MKRIVIAVISAGVLLVWFLLGRPNTRLEVLVGQEGRTIPFDQAAIESEVVQAELAHYGQELIPALRAELKRGLWRRGKWQSQVIERGQWLFGNYFSRVESEQDGRRAKAALCLGRLGPLARDAIPELEAVAAAGGFSAGPEAEVALAIIQPDNPTVQSNALAALTSTSQPRRYRFALRAHELWPSRPELIEGMLNDVDATIRSTALTALGEYGHRAGHAVPVIRQLLDDPYPRVRTRAALALGLVAPEYADTVVAVMLDQQRTNNAWTGDYAHVLYLALGPAARTAAPALEAQLKEPRETMFHGDAAAALWRITGKATPEIVAGLGEGVRLGVQRSQLRCLRALREIGPPAAAAAPALQSLTNHPRVLIRQLAREALESVNRPPAKQYFIRRSLELLDLVETPTVNASAVYDATPEKVVPNASAVPVWKVRLENAPLRLTVDGTRMTNPFLYKMELVFSATTRMLLAFTTVWPENVSGEPFPSIEKYEKATQGCSFFQGVPENAPETTLLAALSTPGAMVFNAKQVVAFYTLGSFEPTEKSVHPIWVIHAMGIPPLALSFGGIPASAEEQAKRPKAETFHTKFRFVIDANTGSPMGGDNAF